jgi:hypothetical protein
VEYKTKRAIFMDAPAVKKEAPAKIEPIQYQKPPILTDNRPAVSTAGLERGR